MTTAASGIESGKEGIPFTDEPAHSSAALCIRLSLLSQTFGPDFTHQCFPSEYIRGYVPRACRLDGHHRHSSYQQHENAGHELDVHVKLAPSCETCCVTMSVEKKTQPLPRYERASKRYKTLVQVSSETSEANQDNSPEDDSDHVQRNSEADEDESYADSDEDLSESGSVRDEAEGSSRKRRMPINEIKERLSKALPNVVQEDCSGQYLRRPLGNVLKEYKSKEQDFCLTICPGAKAKNYHREVQKLAIFYIETADEVNVGNEKEGYWTVLYLFRKHTVSQFSFVGYLTIFHFASPFRKPKPGTIMRVCQALILPPYQRAGHGQVMLHAVHEQAMRDEEIVEINVEDPAPGFQSLRNLVDYETFLQSEKSWFEDSSQIKVTDPTFFLPLTESSATIVAATVNLTSRQVQIVYELDKLHKLQIHHKENNVSESQKEEFDKMYRLMVKKRLNRLHREELGACLSKQDMQNRLSTLFDEYYVALSNILQRVHRCPKV